RAGNVRLAAEAREYPKKLAVPLLAARLQTSWRCCVSGGGVDWLMARACGVPAVLRAARYAPVPPWLRRPVSAARRWLERWQVSAVQTRTNPVRSSGPVRPPPDCCRTPCPASPSVQGSAMPSSRAAACQRGTRLCRLPPSRLAEAAQSSAAPNPAEPRQMALLPRAYWSTQSVRPQKLWPLQLSSDLSWPVHR